jgi:hypothetical protein
MDETMELSPSSETSAAPVSIENLQATIQRMAEELKRYQSDLQEARKEIALLRTQQLSSDDLPRNQLNDSQQFPVLSQSMNQPNSAPWRDASRVESMKQSMIARRRERRTQRQETAARFFQEPSENQGFQYIYIPTKARIPVGQFRSYLRKLDINNSRILDIHYPTRNVAALLIHNDYVPDLKAHLQKFRVKVKEDFDPCDGHILMDPRYATNTDKERDSYAIMHHTDRMKRALNYIRAPVKFAVARYFHTKGWISKDTLDETLAIKAPNPVDVFLIDNDEEMSIGESNEPMKDLQ